MTATEIRQAVERAMLKRSIRKATKPEETTRGVGGLIPTAMTQPEIQEILKKVHGATGVNNVEDGTRVHLHYKSFGVPTQQGIRCAARAAELGLSRDRYTGRIHRVWKSSKGEQCITMWVELERDHMYRTLNLERGEVLKFVVLGE